MTLARIQAIGGPLVSVKLRVLLAAPPTQLASNAALFTVKVLVAECMCNRCPVPSECPQRSAVEEELYVGAPLLLQVFRFQR